MPDNCESPSRGGELADVPENLKKQLIAAIKYTCQHPQYMTPNKRACAFKEMLIVVTLTPYGERSAQIKQALCLPTADGATFDLLQMRDEDLSEWIVQVDSEEGGTRCPTA